MGKKAIQFVLKEAKKEKIKAIHLEVEEHNKAGTNLYDKFKFKKHKRLLLTRWL